jgi:lipoprotein-anchoring transpeptidase ErfK/SrfK
VRVLIAGAGVLASMLTACSSTTTSGGQQSSTPPAGAGGSSAHSTSAGAPSTTAPGASASSSHSSAKPVPTNPVHVSLFQGDGSTYGVGFAIIAQFDKAPTDSKAFTHAVTVTVDGKPAHGAWFWQRSEIPGYAVEALYRQRTLWPAHARINAKLPLKGLSAGRGLAFDDSLTLSLRTGARHVSVVDNQTHRMSVYSDGKLIKRMPVSLGEGQHPTYKGIKVVMGRGENIPGTSRPRPQGAVRMTSNAPGDHYDLLVPWSLRITNSGEYVHSASWNTGNIGSRNTSHGCTNLDVAAAKWFWHFSQVGDVVRYPNATGRTQPSWDGWGWWNLPWPTWKLGGLLRTH